MKVLYRRSNKSAMLEKNIHDQAIIFTLLWSEITMIL